MTMTTMTELDRFLARPRPRAKAAVRLVCFPFAGGGTSVYHGWAGRLPAGVELCAVKLPGRESRLAEPRIDRVGALLDVLTPALRPVLDRPFAIYGHSMGALVGFEWARRLVGEGGPAPAHFFAAAHRAPHLPDRLPPITDLSDAAFIRETRRRYGAASEALCDPDLAALLLPALRADCRLCDHYRFEEGVTLTCPITALGGRSDTSAPLADLRGWAGHTTGRFEMACYDGGHFFLHACRDAVIDTISGVLGPLGDDR